MAHVARELCMVRVKHKAGDGVPEVFSSPCTVARGAGAGETCENILSGVAPIALEALMECSQRPAGPALMVETGLCLAAVASIATLGHVVAAFANLMSALRSNGLRGCALVLLMTSDATLTAMALRTLDAKQIDMLIMVEGYEPALVVTSFQNESRRLLDNRMAAHGTTLFV